MALRTFETDTARYYLGLGNHHSSSAPIFEDVDLESLDFLVLEGADSKVASDTLNTPQYGELCSRFKDKNQNAPIYSVDQASLTSVGIHGAYIGISMCLGLVLPLVGVQAIKHDNILEGLGLIASGVITGCDIPLGISIGFSGKRNQPLITAVQNIKTGLVPTPLVSFRDAIAAKKTAEYLVPKHQHQDGSKVQVGILYGCAHSGIEPKLKHPRIANATIRLYHTLLGFGNTKQLNEVREIVPGREEFVKYDCGLFT